MPIPHWLRWLAIPDPRPERATPRPVLLTDEVTEEEALARVGHLAEYSADIAADFAEAVADITAAVNAVRTRQFIASLPAVHHRPTTWPTTAPTPREVLEREFPKPYRKGHR